MDARYLGDGVYASFDGNQIWLDLRGQDDFTKIALDQDTFDNLITFRDDILVEVLDNAVNEIPDKKEGGNGTNL